MEVASPICIYLQHCGSKAALGPPEPRPGCVQQTITCLTCGATGVRSTNTERRDG